MRVAVVGSRGIHGVGLDALLPDGVTEIISGGARGADAAARVWAHSRGIPLREFLPDYRRYGRGAPLRRNEEIIAAAEYLLILWDGASPGTRYVLTRCMECRKPFRLVIMRPS